VTLLSGVVDGTLRHLRVSDFLPRIAQSNPRLSVGSYPYTRQMQLGQRGKEPVETNKFWEQQGTRKVLVVSLAISLRALSICYTQPRLNAIKHYSRYTMTHRLAVVATN
jgi:hypothetical protein